jgi:hypothetical protein
MGYCWQDPAGLDCRDDLDAEHKAETIAQQIATGAPPTAVPRYIAVLDEERHEVALVPVERTSSWGKRS